MKYLEQDLFQAEFGPDIREMIATAVFEPSDHPLLLDESITRVSFPYDPGQYDATHASHLIGKLAYELTLKMECDAAAKYPGVLISSDGPDKASEVARIFSKRIFQRHPLYDPFLCTDPHKGQNYEVNMNFVFAMGDTTINGANHRHFIYSVATCVWRLPLPLPESVRSLFGFSHEKGKLPSRTFERYLESYHTGSDDFPREDL